jgi:hypothetical protein
MKAWLRRCQREGWRPDAPNRGDSYMAADDRVVLCNVRGELACSRIIDGGPSGYRLRFEEPDDDSDAEEDAAEDEDREDEDPEEDDEDAVTPGV